MKLFEVESYNKLDSIAEVMLINGVDYVRTADTNNIYHLDALDQVGYVIGLVKPEEALGILCEALGIDNDDDIPEEYMSQDMIDYLTEPEDEESYCGDIEMPTEEANLLLIDDIINNTLSQKVPIEPQQADTLLKLARLKQMLKELN